MTRHNPHRYTTQVRWFVVAQFGLAALCFSTWLTPIGFTLLPEEILLLALPPCLIVVTIAGVVLSIRHRRSDWLLWGTAIAAVAMALSVAALLLTLSLDCASFQE